LENWQARVRIHSAKAVIADKALRSHATVPNATHFVTKRPGLLLGVLAADCAPIVICDPHNGVVALQSTPAGVAAVDGVIEAAVEAHGSDWRRSVKKMAAALALARRESSFEVGPDLADAVLDRLASSPWAETLFEPGTKTTPPVLRPSSATASAALPASASPTWTRLPTTRSTQPESYFSHRCSAVKAGDRDCGRNVTGIMLLGLDPPTPRCQQHVRFSPKCQSVRPPGSPGRCENTPQTTRWIHHRSRDCSPVEICDRSVTPRSPLLSTNRGGVLRERADGGRGLVAAFPTAPAGPENRPGQLLPTCVSPIPR